MPLDPVGGFLQNLGNFTGGPGFAHLFDADKVFLTGDGIGQEHSNAVYPGNALSFSGIIRDNGFIDSIFLQHTLPSFRNFSYDTTKNTGGKEKKAPGG